MTKVPYDPSTPQEKEIFRPDERATQGTAAVTATLLLFADRPVHDADDLLQATVERLLVKGVPKDVVLDPHSGR